MKVVPCLFPDLSMTDINMRYPDNKSWVLEKPQLVSTYSEFSKRQGKIFKKTRVRLLFWKYFLVFFWKYVHFQNFLQNRREKLKMKEGSAKKTEHTDKKNGNQRKPQANLTRWDGGLRDFIFCQKKEKREKEEKLKIY